MLRATQECLPVFVSVNRLYEGRDHEVQRG